MRSDFNLIHTLTKQTLHLFQNFTLIVEKKKRALSDSPRIGTEIHSHIESKYSEVSPPTWWFLGYGQFEGSLWRPIQLIGLDGYISGTSSPENTSVDLIFNYFQRNFFVALLEVVDITSCWTFSHI